MFQLLNLENLSVVKALRFDAELHHTKMHAGNSLDQWIWKIFWQDPGEKRTVLLEGFTLDKDPAPFLQELVDAYNEKNCASA